MGLAYVLAIPDPASHLLDVTVEIPTGGARELTVVMPAWSPGSYLIRDYARFVRNLEAGACEVVKTDKSSWKVMVPDGAPTLTVRYQVYAHDLTVRTNHVD